MIKAKRLLPLTNKQILKNVRAGSKSKKKASNGLYYYIYKVTCSKNEMVFVSACATDVDPDTDPHISKSIVGRTEYHKYKRGLICYGAYLRRHGKVNFKRTDLLFFDSLTELIEAEKLIITEEFRNDNRTMNFSFHFDYTNIWKHENVRLNGFITPEDRLIINNLMTKPEA